VPLLPLPPAPKPSLRPPPQRGWERLGVRVLNEHQSHTPPPSNDHLNRPSPLCFFAPLIKKPTTSPTPLEPASPKNSLVRKRDHIRATPHRQKIKNPTPLFPTKTPPPHDLVRKKGPKRAPPTGPLEAQYAPAKPDHPLALCPWRPWLLGVHPSSPSSLRSLRLSGPSLPTRPKPRQTTP